MKWLPLPLLLAALAAIPAGAQYPPRVRPCDAPTVPHPAPGYGPGPVAFDHGPEIVFVPKAVYAYRNRDFYYSVGDAYRDALLADAIAYRLGGKPVAGGLDQYPVPRIPPAAGGRAERPAGAARAGGGGKAAGGVPEGLQAVVDAQCLSCHSGATAPDLSDLAAVSYYDRLESYAQVNTGAMPKGKKPVSDGDVALFLAWKEAARSARAAK